MKACFLQYKSFAKIQQNQRNGDAKDCKHLHANEIIQSAQNVEK